VILVTGASGFVGTRLCEHLRLGLGRPVRALIHRPERAARVARLDVELARTLDLRGCDAIVHLAYATTGTARTRRRGTEALARRVADAAGDRRLVHVSTAAVWGFDARGVLDETSPARPSGDAYVDGKLAAEAAVRAASANHAILRPTNVWGPWGPAFTVAPVRALREGGVAVVGAGAGPANVVYIDNLCHAIVEALDADAARGETFIVNDPEQPSWRELYDAYASIGGWSVRTVEPSELPRPSRLRAAAAELAAHPRARALARALPGRDRVRAAIQPAAGLPSPELAALQTSGVAFATDKARRVLGYAPPVTFERGMRLTEEWLRFARLV